MAIGYLDHGWKINKQTNCGYWISRSRVPENTLNKQRTCSAEAIDEVVKKNTTSTKLVTSNFLAFNYISFFAPYISHAIFALKLHLIR